MTLKRTRCIEDTRCTSCARDIAAGETCWRFFDDLLCVVCAVAKQQPSGGSVAAEPHFDGETYDPKHDHARLTGQTKRVFQAMSDGQFRTLDQISEITGDPTHSVSARLRDLRKEKFGSFTINRRSRGDRARGLWEYQLENGS